PRLTWHQAGPTLSTGDAGGPCDGATGGTAARQGRGVPGGRRVGVLRDREVPDLRPAVAARPARALGGRPRGERRIREGRPPRFRPLEEGGADRRAGG